MQKRGAIVGIGLAALSLTAARIYSARKLRRSRARFPPVGQFVNAAGTRLHYVATGEGRDVVFLHGSGLVLQDFTTSVFDRVAAWRRAIAFDRLGHGYSERPPDGRLSLAANARVVHEALQRISAGRPILVGHSSGASVALRYVLDYPDEVSGLVLLSPTAFDRGISFPPPFYLATAPLLGPLLLNTVAPPLLHLAAPAFVAAMFAPDRAPAGYRDMIEAFTIRPAHFAAFSDELMALGSDLRAQQSRYGEIDGPGANCCRRFRSGRPAGNSGDSFVSRRPSSASKPDSRKRPCGTPHASGCGGRGDSGG